ncbi:Zinc finger CCCH domain-containing protein 30 [Linum grandiflorum]
MCGGPDKSSSSDSTESPSIAETTSDVTDMKHLTVETEDSFSSLLELAANNDVEGFKRSVERDASSIDEVGFWYSRQKGSRQIVLERRTPLMVAATYGSVDVLRLVLSQTQADVNFSCGMDQTTALHCAASGGSVNVVDVVKLLLSSGADPNVVDANGHRPIDVVIVPPKLQNLRFILEGLLSNISYEGTGAENYFNGGIGERNLRVSVITSSSSSPTLSSSPRNGSPPSPSVLVSSPMSSKFCDQPGGFAGEKKEYPIDPSLPDIKNSIYATDEFRMYSFKVRPCSRAYSHDWTECPFVHPGENARRRDPRKFHYSCVPCPDFRKGACRRGDMCEYAHGVFECWLHPAQYRTRLCKDGTSCNRRVCFFAHTPEELRPLYVSTGSAVPSPRSSAASVMDMAAALSMLPGSPSSVSAMSPTSFNGGGGWPQPNVPALHLPGSNLHQSSRLRSSLCARDIPPEDFDLFHDFDTQQHMLNDLTCFSSQQSWSNNSPSMNRSGRTKTLTPSNLDELFSAELSSSPRYSDQGAAVFSPTHKSALLNQFQQQQQSMLSPINTNHLQTSYGVGSPGRMSPRAMEPISPMSARLSTIQREKQFRSLSSRDLGANNNSVSSAVGSPVSSWSKWGSPNGKLDWSVSGEELGRLKRSSSFGNGNNCEEPDLSWVQSLVKESPLPSDVVKGKYAVTDNSGTVSSGEGMHPNSEMDSVIESWLEQMHIDQQQEVVV